METNIIMLRLTNEEIGLLLYCLNAVKEALKKEPGNVTERIQILENLQEYLEHSKNQA